MAKTYTVKQGDTLYQIGIDNGTDYRTLAKINNLPIVKRNGQDYVYLVVGQVIKLSDDGTTPTKVTTGQVKILDFGLQSGTDRGVYARWSWDRENTQEYTVQWQDYYDGYWHDGTTTATVNNSQFTANTQATKVRVRVKPVAKTYTNSKGKEVAHWTNVSWTTYKTYSFSSNPPSKPTSIPDVKIEADKLTATLDNLTSLNASIVQFEVSKDDSPGYKLKPVAINKVDTASVVLTIDLGGRYKVRARTIKSDQPSAWTAWSEEKTTVPATPEIKKCMMGSDDMSIDLEWTPLSTATEYTIECTPYLAVFEGGTTDTTKYSVTVNATQVKNGFINVKSDEIATWAQSTDTKNIYVRVCASNDQGDSTWSETAQTNTGGGPASPTVSSSKTVINVGETVDLQWTHNVNDNEDTTDSSSSDTKKHAKYSHIDLYINGVKKVLPTVIHMNGSTIETNDDKSYTLDTKTESSYATIVVGDVTYNVYQYVDSELYYFIIINNVGYVVTKDDSGIYTKTDTTVEIPDVADISTLKVCTDGVNEIVCPEGATLTWRVRTAGENGLLGEWSPLRVIEVYSAPVLTLTDANDAVLSSDTVYTLEQFPLTIKGSVADTTQQYIIGYHVGIVSNTSYEAVNNYGETIYISEGETIYNRAFDDIQGYDEFEISLSAGDVTLATDASYTLTCTVTMNSGLSVSQALTYNVLWSPAIYFIDAEIEIDPDDYTALIRPYCEDVHGGRVEDLYMYVYRREYDGTFTRISGDIDNSTNTYVLDPHPALDYARYRVVATDKKGGVYIYDDINDYKVGCKSIIIQWDENYHDFSITDEDDEYDSMPWSGQKLILPYNIDTASRYSRDVSLVEYIGREFPVSYYGTQLGETATWNVAIPKSDTETIYALRRLQRWMGDVYVREPSGVGYWAHINVSFNQKHLNLTIPVSIDITRVEGGK